MKKKSGGSLAHDVEEDILIHFSLATSHRWYGLMRLDGNLTTRWSKIVDGISTIALKNGRWTRKDGVISTEIKEANPGISWPFLCRTRPFVSKRMQIDGSAFRLATMVQVDGDAKVWFLDASSQLYK